jgi:hypothetical protein
MQFRLVLHSFSAEERNLAQKADPPDTNSAPGEAHGDLFIKADGVLITYEWPYSELPAKNDEHFERLVEDSAGILLTRKADHRLHYWTHEGEVSKGRGSVAELLRGEIEIKAGFPDQLRVRPYSST